MNYKIYQLLHELDLFDHLKIFKDKFFKSKIEISNEQSRFNFYSKLIRNNNLCFDIGANYGNRTEIFLKLGAKVIAVEPQPALFRFLRRKFKDKIIIEDKAVGSKQGKANLYISSASSLTSMSEEWINKVKIDRFKHENWNQTIEVEVITLDYLIEKYGRPDFCKIDVEGFEQEVLKGLSQPIPLISFEFTIPEFFERAIFCIEHLKTMGNIICNFSEGETLSLNLLEWLEPSEFIEKFKTLSLAKIKDGDIYVKFLEAC